MLITSTHITFVCTLLSSQVSIRSLHKGLFSTCCSIQKQFSCCRFANQMQKENGKMPRLYRRRDLVAVFFVGALTGIALWHNRAFLMGQEDLINGFARDVVVPMEPFPEPAWRTPATLAAKVVASTPFARFEIHKVRTESGAIINDWLWTDERSHVNILVHLKDEDKYLMFYQKKYGLEKPYYAVIGGLFNKGETGIECAQRELLEETGLEAENLIDLGKYRVQVNRGGGILYAYLAKNCVKSKKHSTHAEKATKLLSPDVLDADYEKQEHRKLTRSELIKVALEGKVGEAQWVAAVALGLLYDEHHEHHQQ